jgi:hypothetical protein
MFVGEPSELKVVASAEEPLTAMIAMVVLQSVRILPMFLLGG